MYGMNSIVIVVVVLCLSAASRVTGNSCVGNCGAEFDPSLSCQCDAGCTSNNNCCDDYSEACLSCKDRCGEINSNNPCNCNAACEGYNDCCDDYSAICLSCEDRCGDYGTNFPCNCNEACQNYNDCCGDYETHCESDTEISDDEILSLSRDMLSSSGHSGALISLDYQGQTTSGETSDEAPDPLIDYLEPSVLDIPTIDTMRKLFNNYDPDENVPEQVTSEEDTEVDGFLSTVMETNTMKILHEFLARKGRVSQNEDEFKAYLKQIWFDLYERNGQLSSSGFEHVFLGEIDNGGIGGFHNWVFYYDLEQSGCLDYKGWIDKEVIDELPVVSLRMSWDDANKSFNTLLYGLHPEYELGIYTLCYIARPDAQCTVQLGQSTTWNVQTYVMDYNNKQYVATAYFL